jgi:ABC-type Fe3+ transport system substrate-binding protein
LRPEWKGKIASHDPRGAGAGQAVANYLLVTFGERFIIDLFKGQDVVLTRSYSQVADWLAQGKYAIGIAQVQDRIESLRKEGIALTADGLADAQGYLTGGFSVIALPKRAPHPNAATVFLNWFLTRPGQEAFHRPHLYPSLRTDVPREYVPEYILPKPQLEYVDGYGEDMIAIQHKLGEQVRELLGR